MKHHGSHLAAAILLLSGCAFFGKASPLDVRYFTLDEGTPAAASVAPAPAVAGKRLGLGSVTAAAHLQARMVFRDSGVELGFHELQRWSERPDAYVRRAVTRALFQERGVEQVLSGGGHVLDVDLLALDELTGDSPKVRVTLVYSLHDDVRVALENTITIEKPIAKKDDAHAKVTAFREALHEAIATVADQTVVKLATLPNSPEGVSKAAENGSALEQGGSSSAGNDHCANLTGAELVKCRKKQVNPSASPKAH